MIRTGLDLDVFQTLVKSKESVSASDIATMNGAAPYLTCNY